MDEILGDTATAIFRHRRKKQYFRGPLCGGLILLRLVAWAAAPLSLQQVQGLVAAMLGPRASVFDGHYVIGDFDADGRPDVAIMVNVEEAIPDIEARRIRLLDTDPNSDHNGSTLSIDSLGHRCMGLLILPNYAGQGHSHNELASSAPLLSYACFSGFRVFTKGQDISESRRLPQLHADALLLEMETGATNLVYWDGHTFRGFQLEIGD